MLGSVYVETYGCRMNLLDSEVILRILLEEGYVYTSSICDADVIVINSCSVREAGHIVVEQRLQEIGNQIGTDSVLCLTGCMVTQVTDAIFDRFGRLQILAEPTTYHSLGQAIRKIQGKQEEHIALRSTNTHEVYDYVLPVRKLEDQVTAAITIMKGCNRYCSYCIEPFTRGEITNRSYDGIIHEAQCLCQEGYKEITLFGHIVDVWKGQHNGKTINFAQLLDDLADSCPSLRIKFISSHPQTLNNEIVSTMAKHDNIMRVVHFPIQSGNNEILRKMNRGYTIEEALYRIKELRTIIPDLQIISDIMVGFPTETEEQFNKTLQMLQEAQFADINCFSFSMRKGTSVHKSYSDDVPDEEKQSRMRRVREVNTLLRAEQGEKAINTEVELIAEQQQVGGWYGRDKWHRSIFFSTDTPMHSGDICRVRISGFRDNHLYGEKI